MKNRTKIRTGLLISLFLLGACNNPQVLVTVGKDSITKETLYEEMKKKLGEDTLTKLTYQKILEKKYSVNNEEIEDALTAYKEQGSEKYQSILNQTNQSESILKDKLRYQLLIEKSVEANYEIKEEDLQEYYVSWQPGKDVRHILFGSESLAKIGEQELKEGTSFAKLVEKYSIDVTTNQNEGLMRDVTTGSVDSAFEKATFELKNPGDISGIIQSAFGYHLIQLVETSTKTTFEEDREYVRKKYIQEQVGEKEKQAILAEEFKQAKVTIKDNFFKESFQ